MSTWTVGLPANAGPGLCTGGAGGAAAVGSSYNGPRKEGGHRQLGGTGGPFGAQQETHLHPGGLTSTGLLLTLIRPSGDNSTWWRPRRPFSYKGGAPRAPAARPVLGFPVPIQLLRQVRAFRSRYLAKRRADPARTYDCQPPFTPPFRSCQLLSKTKRGDSPYRPNNRSPRTYRWRGHEPTCTSAAAAGHPAPAHHRRSSNTASSQPKA